MTAESPKNIADFWASKEAVKGRLGLGGKKRGAVQRTVESQGGAEGLLPFDRWFRERR
jgi:hypothetical protein